MPPCCLSPTNLTGPAHLEPPDFPCLPQAEGYLVNYHEFDGPHTVSGSKRQHSHLPLGAADVVWQHARLLCCYGGQRTNISSALIGLVHFACLLFCSLQVPAAIAREALAWFVNSKGQPASHPRED